MGSTLPLRNHTERKNTVVLQSTVRDGRRLQTRGIGDGQTLLKRVVNRRVGIAGYNRDIRGSRKFASFGRGRTGRRCEDGCGGYRGRGGLREGSDFRVQS